MATSDTHHPELDCWGAACTALASVAPRFGVGPREVRRLCLAGAAEAEREIEQVQLMAAFLLEGIAERGGDKESLVEIASQAFHAHRRLQESVTVSDLI